MKRPAISYFYLFRASLRGCWAGECTVLTSDLLSMRTVISMCLSLWTSRTGNLTALRTRGPWEGSLVSRPSLYTKSMWLVAYMRYSLIYSKSVASLYLSSLGLLAAIWLAIPCSDCLFITALNTVIKPSIFLISLLISRIKVDRVSTTLSS